MTSISPEKRKALVLGFYDQFKEFPEVIKFKNFALDWEIYECQTSANKCEMALREERPHSYTYTAAIWTNEKRAA